MTRSAAAEWLKLSKRPAVWVLAAVLVAIVVTLEYGVLFLVLLAQPKNVNFGPGVTADLLRRQLFPSHFVASSMSSLTSFGSAIALILGVLAYGSEYGWSTLKTIFTQGPSRLATYAGKLVVIAGFLLLFAVLILAASAATSAVIGAYYGADSSWPPVTDVLKGLAAAWLVLGVWAGFGLALSILFRQSALAIGLGLVYSIAFEGIVLTLLGQFSWARGAEQVFPGANVSALVRSFTSAVAGANPNAAPALVSPTQATLVLLAYLALFVVLGAVFLRRRDVV
jgi:ABC-type transport system involved in multi-copper enzyme maturation permease subunit